MMSFKLALRNVISHRQRNSVIFLVVTLVTMLVFLFLSFSDGEIDNMKNGMASFVRPYSDLNVQTKGLKAAFDKKQDNWKSMTLKDYQPVLDELRKLPFIDRAFEKVWRMSVNDLHDGKRSSIYFLTGVNTKEAASVREKIRIDEGDFFQAGESYVLMLPFSTRQDFPLTPGDKVVLYGKDLFGQMISQEFTFKGYYTLISDSPNAAMSGIVDLDGYKILSGYYENELHQLGLILKKGTDFQEARNFLENWAKVKDLNLEFTDARDESKDFTMIYETIRWIFVVMSLIIIFIVTIGIMNVVSVNLFDRKREIGTYYCLGTEKGFLSRMYTWELLLVNLAASLTGILAGLLIREGINLLGLTTTEPGMQLVFGGSKFVMGISVSTIAWILASIPAVTVITSLMTLGKSLRVSPVSAIRETEE